MKQWFAFLVWPILIMGCELQILHPTPDAVNSCGVGWVSCNNHHCCPEGDECNVPTCPPGQCCLGAGGIGDGQMQAPQIEEPRR